jgi:site-specific DNA recombinase
LLTGNSGPSKNRLSNPADFIDHSLEICLNLSGLWVSSGYVQKVQLQDLLFPGGILFDKQKENYRTEKVNSVLELTHSFTQTLKGNKKGQTKNFLDLPALVDPTGIEPFLHMVNTIS